jgi:hypothetical protein
LGALLLTFKLLIFLHPISGRIIILLRGKSSLGGREDNVTIRQFELFHGAVLAKLVRSDRPLTLRMIETRPGEAWAVYTINDEVELFLKHSASVNELAREPGSLSWQFAYTPGQVAQIDHLRSMREVYTALVCGRRNIKLGNMQICLLDPRHIDRLIDFTNIKSQSVTVKYIPGKKLRVYSRYSVEFLVSQNSLDKWEVPGS